MSEQPRVRIYPAKQDPSVEKRPGENSGFWIKRLFDAGEIMLVQFGDEVGRLIAWEIDEEGNPTRCESELS